MDGFLQVTSCFLSYSLKGSDTDLVIIDKIIVTLTSYLVLFGNIFIIRSINSGIFLDNFIVTNKIFLRQIIHLAICRSSLLFTLIEKQSNLLNRQLLPIKPLKIILFLCLQPSSDNLIEIYSLMKVCDPNSQVCELNKTVAGWRLMVYNCKGTLKQTFFKVRLCNKILLKYH